MSEDLKKDYFKGRGAQVNSLNPFDKRHYVEEHIEGLDEPLLSEKPTKYFYETPKKFLNKVTSEDVGMDYSGNPYQGCEHGCIYCYARNSHQYWGFSAGLDFERNIIIKQNAPELLEKELRNKNWDQSIISFSGNTDCYQPIERKLEITRKLLQVCLDFRNPVGIITKNALILRDLDILKQLAERNLIRVTISITSLSEETRLAMEPRTATAKKRLQTLQTLSENGIPCGVNVAPIVPGLTSDEIPAILEAAGNAGATHAGYTIVRLNGSIGGIFKDWVYKNYPDRADKIWNQICECHGGNVNDSNWGRRMRGDGPVAQSIAQLFKISRRKFIKESDFEYNRSDFRIPGNNQLNLFGE